MDKTRRNLIKGMLTGGTLLALGVPGMAPAIIVNPAASGSIRPSRLLLGNTPISEVFIKGANAAWAAHTHSQQGLLPIAKLEDILFDNPAGTADLLRQPRPLRWIAITDEAHAAILTELIRNIDGRLLALGFHIYSANDALIPLRHRWTTASPAYSVGEKLATMLIQNQPQFSIVENFLEKPVVRNEDEALPIAGFSAYRSTEQDIRDLHCAGLLPSEANVLIGEKTAHSWQLRSSGTASGGPEVPKLENWVEMTSFALVTTALGINSHQTSCTSRAFVCRSNQRNLHTEVFAGTHFVSFIFDV